jgi:L-fucose mutarotase
MLESISPPLNAEKARAAYCAIATGKRRFDGCFLFSKGVIGPDGE